MRIATITDLHTQPDLGNYKLRANTAAVPCPDGATIVDAAGAGIASFPGRCYLIVNDIDESQPHDIGDKFALVPADVFEALFNYDSPADTTTTTTTEAEAQPANTFGGSQTPAAFPQVVHNDDGSVTVDGVTYNPPPVEPAP